MRLQCEMSQEVAEQLRELMEMTGLSDKAELLTVALNLKCQTCFSVRLAALDERRSVREEFVVRVPAKGNGSGSDS